MMIVDMVMARELAYFEVRGKDFGKRCDIQAGKSCIGTSACPTRQRNHGNSGLIYLSRRNCSWSFQTA
jgi:hypothetical protein